MASNNEVAAPVSQEDIEAAEKLKNEANEYFKSKSCNYKPVYAAPLLCYLLTENV